MEHVTLIVIDETIFEYHPSTDVKKKSRIEWGTKVVHIPRKPHPNGLLTYTAASFIFHPLKPSKVIPFIIGLQQCLVVGDMKPTLARTNYGEVTDLYSYSNATDGNLLQNLTL